MIQRQKKKLPLLATIGLSLLLGSTSVLADKPSWAGGGEKPGHGRGNEQQDNRRDFGREDRQDDRHEWNRRDEHRGDDRHGGDRYDHRGEAAPVIRFGFNDRDYIRNYYRDSIRAQGCPPGLAKKHNGCLPPGQAKKWRRGAPLPGGIEIYDLPRDLSIRLGTPPAGYRYVRVASDILMIAVGTGLVVDAIEDLGGR